MASFALAIGVVVAWYYSPAKVQGMDQMLYCACGYSTVEFKEGKITMIEFPHETVHAGDLIGRYSVTGNDVEMEIYFRARTNIARYRVDNIGIRAHPTAGTLWEYQAFESKSLKARMWRFLSNAL